MTEPTLKLDLDDDPPNQPAPPGRRGVVRWLVVASALAALFGGVALGMLLALPRPHTSTDYMIAGGLATMVTMLALFGVLLSTQSKVADSFFKRRPK